MILRYFKKNTSPTKENLYSHKMNSHSNLYMIWKQWNTEEDILRYVSDPICPYNGVNVVWIPIFFKI